MTSKLRKRKQGHLLSEYYYGCCIAFLLVALVPQAGNHHYGVASFTPPQIIRTRIHPHHDSPPPTRTISQQRLPIVLMAKRNKKQDDDDLNRWYDDVDSNASPDDVFWEEMERQRLQNQLTDGRTSGTAAVGTPDSASVYDTAPAHGTGSTLSDLVTDALASRSSQMAGTVGAAATGTMDKKSAEATLQEFSAFAVQDNWLDDDLVALYNAEQNDFVSENAKPLEEQLDEWEQQQQPTNGWKGDDDEPWDHFGEEPEEDEDNDDDDGGALRLETMTGRFVLCDLLVCVVG